jgi:hypothetical protein
MSWNSLPDEIQAFAVQLMRLDEQTRPAGNVLISLHGAFDHQWRHRRTVSSDLAIPVPLPRDKGLHPRTCELSEAEIRFKFSMEGVADDAGIPNHAELQVRVVGCVMYENCIVDLEDHWRIDTHNFAGTPNEPHPFIHFQRGGHAQEGWAGRTEFVPGPLLPNRGDGNWTSLLQTSGPRLAVPPLCPILAIDFVIAQHDGKLWRRLRDNPEYRALVEMAQERLWKPFFAGLATKAIQQKWLGPIVI